MWAICFRHSRRLDAERLLEDPGFGRRKINGAEEAEFEQGVGGGIKLIHSKIGRSQERRTVISAIRESVGLGSWAIWAS